MESRSDKMNKFEKWQVFIGCIQATLLLLALISAIYIGLKQNQINEKLLNLNYIPSVVVGYTPENKRIQIFNKGNSNIWVWGTKYLNTKPNIKDEPRLITPNGSYYILGEEFESLIKRKFKKDGEIFVPFDLFIEGSNNLKYIVRNQLYCKVENNKVSIHPQTLSIIQQDWSEKVNNKS
jgi:hypothetical protein